MKWKIKRKIDKIYASNPSNPPIREKTFKNLAFLLASYVPDTPPPSVSISSDPYYSAFYDCNVKYYSRKKYIEIFEDKYTEIRDICILPIIKITSTSYVISGFKLNYTVAGEIESQNKICYRYDEMEA